MSKVPPINIINQHETNKKILAKSPRHREKDLIGPNSRYRDDDNAIYKNKMDQFMKTAKMYNRLNQETLTNNRRRIHQDYLYDLDFQFLEKEFPPTEGCAMVECHCPVAPNVSKYLKKRTQRDIDTEDIQPIEICNIEPWTRKNLILKKFIKTVWIVIKKNRLLKVLETFKTLNEDIVKELSHKHRKCYNETYRELFEKFL